MMWQPHWRFTAMFFNIFQPLAVGFFLVVVVSFPCELRSQERDNRIVVGHDKFGFGSRSAKGNGATRLGRVSIFLDEPMEVHIRANTSATCLAGRADFTTGFSLERLPQDLKRLDWSESARFVTIPAAKTWVNLGSVFTVELGRGDHTIYWYAGNVKGGQVKFDAGAMSVQAFPLSSRSPGRTAKKLALLIGVDKYRSRSVSNLRGCVNDIDDMEHLLMNRFDFDDNQVLRLTNENATRTNIIQAFEQHLIDKADASTAVVFHYSGHGSQTRDRNGDEVDGLDETIVTHDSRTSEGGRIVRDITDDEIHALFRRLAKKTPHVTFLFDSCHSGTITRAMGGVSRWTDPQDNAQVEAILARQQNGELPAEGVVTRAAQVSDEGNSYVLISGCAPKELSYEMSVGGQRRGALSYYFVSAIRNNRKEGVTYRDIFREVQANVTAKFSGQHPQIEGEYANSAVFFVPAVPRSPHIEMVRGIDGTLKLAEGSLGGITIGSTFAVFKVGESESTPERRLGTVEITSAGPFVSYANRIAGQEPPITSWLIQETKGVSADTLLVFVDSDAANEKTRKLLGDLRDRIGNDSDDELAEALIEITNDPSRATLFLTEEQADLLSDEITLTDGSEVLFASNKIDGILEKLLQWGKWYRIAGLENKRSNLRLSLDVQPSEQQGGGTGLVFEHEQAVDIAIRNESDIDVYLTVVNCSSDGSIEIVYPNNGNLPSKLRPRESQVVDLEVLVPEEFQRIRDIHKIIATVEPIDLHSLSQDNLRNVKQNTEESYFWTLLSPSRTTEKVDLTDWATATVNWEVVRPQKPQGE